MWYHGAYMGCGLEQHAGRFLTGDERLRVERAIAEVETLTSAEIKVLIVRHCWGDIHQKASRLFRKHGLDKTAGRNAVMLMLVTTNRQFLIYGDRGIHERVGEGYWEAIRDELARGLKSGRVGEALCGTIKAIGGKLAEHFPVRGHNPNELEDGVAHDE